MTSEIHFDQADADIQLDLEAFRNTPQLLAALIVAQGAAQAVGKDATNSHHNYKYASAEALIEEARGALSPAGVGVITPSWFFLPDGRENQYGQLGRIYVRYLVFHSSGESALGKCSTPVIPERGRPADKAEATALTYNLGYFLRALLLLPRIEASAEVDARDDRPDKQLPLAYVALTSAAKDKWGRGDESKQLFADWLKTEGTTIRAAIALPEQRLRQLTAILRTWEEPLSSNEGEKTEIALDHAASPPPVTADQAVESAEPAPAERDEVAAQLIEQLGELARQKFGTSAESKSAYFAWLRKQNASDVLSQNRQQLRSLLGRLKVYKPEAADAAK